MIIQELVGPARISMGITAVICAVSFYKVFKESLQKENINSDFLKYLKIWISITGITAFTVSHTSIISLGGAYLPHGVVPGFILAFASLFWKPACKAFDSLLDHQVRGLMAYRAIFGAFLFAGAGLELFPPIFALIAGTGDLLAGWLSAVAKESIVNGGGRKWRWLVHGWGTVDLIDVAILGTFVVQPWIVTTQSPGPSLLLPWLAVPLLLALNLHGLRKNFKESQSLDGNG